MKKNTELITGCHRPYLIVLFCMVGVLHHAGGQRVVFSDEIAARVDEQFYIVGELGDRYALMEVNKTKAQIHLYEEDLMPVRVLEVEAERAAYTSVFANTVKDKLHFIYYFRDRGIVFICHRQYDEELIEISHDTLMTIANDGWGQAFSISESADGSKVAITRVLKNQKIRVQCFDLAAREQIYTSQLQTKSKINNDLETTLVANDGSTYVILDRSRRFNRRQPIVLEVYHITASNGEPVAYTMELPSMRRGLTRYLYDDKHSFVNVYGHYADDSAVRMNGLFVLRFSGAHPEIRYFGMVPFDPQLEVEIISEARDKQEGILDIKVQDAVLREDGGLIVLSEIVRVQQRLGGASMLSPALRGGQNWTDFSYDDIICMSIDPSITSHWQQVMHKRQYSQDDDGSYSSFFPFLNRSALHLFYNDEISNNSTVSKYVIEGDGRVTRSSVMSTEYTQLKLQFEQAYQLTGRSLLIPSRISNRVQLVKISY